MNFGQNFAKWHTSLQKAWWGDAATKDNDFAFDYLPKRDGAYDILAIFERMYQGKINGFIAQGFNPLAALPNKKKVSAAMSKLKFLVVIEPLRTETSEFWKNFGDAEQRQAGGHQDRGHPPAGVLLRRGPGNLHELRPRHPVALGRAPSRRAKARSTARSSARCSRSCARCTPRTAARCPTRS